MLNSLKRKGKEESNSEDDSPEKRVEERVEDSPKKEEPAIEERQDSAMNMDSHSLMLKEKQEGLSDTMHNTDLEGIS